jgi:hypothetical protein
MDIREFAQELGADVEAVLAASFRMPCILPPGDLPGSPPVLPPPIVPPPYWGVDCVAQADQPFLNSPTLWDYVLECSTPRRQKANCVQPAPAFFGRYLTRVEKQGITQSERIFLRDRNCKLLLCYNELTNHDHPISFLREKGDAVYAWGRDCARNAADLALKVKAPSGGKVYIYANIDAGYQPSEDFICGWWEGLWGEGLVDQGRRYAPGLYFPAGTGSTLIGRAMKRCKIPGIESLCSIWSWAGQHQRTTDVDRHVFNPPLPSTPNNVDVWQYATTCFAHNVPVPGQKPYTASFDMDLATQQGYDRMWDCEP